MTHVIIGRDVSLSISLDAGITFRLLGPVNVQDMTHSTPTVDATTQSSQNDNSEFCHTGYDSMALSVSGVVHQEAGIDLNFGQPFFTYKDITGLANGSPVTSRTGLFRLANSNELFEGHFLITEFARTGGRSDVQEFSLSLQSSGEDGGIAFVEGSLYDFMIFMESTLPDEWLPFL